MHEQQFPLTPWQRENLPGDQNGLISWQIFCVTLHARFERHALAEAIQEMRSRRDNFRIKLTPTADQQRFIQRNELGVEQLELRILQRDASKRPLIEDILFEIDHASSHSPSCAFYVSGVTPSSFSLSIAYSPAIADPHSIYLIADDIARLYQAKISGEVTSLQDPASYFSYIGGEYAKPRPAAEHRAIVKECSEVVIPMYSNDLHCSGAGTIAQMRSRIDEELSESISKLSAQSRCQSHEVLYSAAVSYLSQLVDQADVPAIVASIRGDYDGDKNLAGPCSVVLRVQNHVNSTASFADNLKQLASSLRNARNDHGFCSGVPAPAAECASSRQAGVIVWINLLATPELISCRDEFIASVPVRREQRFIWMDFHFREDRSPSHVSFSCNNLEDSFARSFFDGLLSFIRAVVRSPESGLLAHRLVSESEQNELLLNSNGNKSSYPAACVHELFERQAELTPHRTAIEFKGQSLTYAELNRRSNGFARRIVSIRPPARSRGRGNYLIGICVDRSLEMVVGMLGAMKAGYAYVPIDPSYPEERMAFLVKDAAIDILLTRRHLAEKLASLDRRIICLDEEVTTQSESFDEYATRNIPTEHVNVTPNDPVAVLYTSGSTGLPKGVFISHKGLVSRLHWMRSSFPFTEDEVAGHIAQLPFVRALWELFIPLTGGTKVVIIDLDTTKDPEKLSRCIGEHKITRLVTAPSLAQTLTSLPDTAVQGLRALKYWFIGGEPLHRKIVTSIRRALPEVFVCNLYGATEVHSFASYYPVLDMADETSRVPIGRPISDTSMLILDRHQRILPAGVHGEICVLGDGVAGGYLNQPELTVEKFIHHRFTDFWSGQLYRTGDIGCRLPDGSTMFVSRMDHQVKIRGIRIELGEVETALLAKEDIDKAVVVSSEFSPNDSRLVAYVVPRYYKENLGLREWRRKYVYLLRRFLERKLPAFMIPSYFVLMEKLPLNAYGKVLRKELPAPSLDSVGSIGYCAPRNEREILLCEIWEHALGIDKVGVLDNFFDLGGHSLLAARIKAGVDDAFSIDLPLREIFERPNISELASTIEKHVGRRLERPVLARTANRTRVSLTEEMRFWEPALWKRSSLSHFSLEILGEVDVDALRNSLAFLIERHDALRMAFERTEHGTYMAPTSDAYLDFEVIDIRGDLCSSQVSELFEKEIVREKVRGLLGKPLDVGCGCLTRWALIRVRPLESVFVGILDHVVVDGASMTILKRELRLAYEAYCKGSRPDLPPFVFGYFDYAHWQERYRQTNAYVAEKEARKGYLNDICSSLKPIRVRHTSDAQRNFHSVHSIDANTQRELSDFCARARITESMLHTAIFHLAVFNTLQLDDIVLMVPASGRRFPELQEVVGLFSYNMFVRSVLATGMSLAELMSETRRNALVAYGNGYIHLERSDIARDMPSCDFCFTYRDFPGNAPWELFNLQIKPVGFVERLESATLNVVGEKSFKLVTRMEKEGGHLVADIIGSGLMFSNASFEKFNSRFLFALRELVRVSDLSLTVGDFLFREEALISRA
jgi:amino acid adenylation domain-containing protein